MNAAKSRRAGKKKAAEPTKSAAVEMEDDRASSAMSSQTGDGNGAPLTESEAGQMMAPDDLAKEEEDLRNQREHGAKKALKENVTPQEATLDSERYEELDKLLNRTGMYTQFLAEQLQAMDEQMSADPEAAVGQKRKAGKQGARMRKKGVATKTTEGSKRVQQELVPLIKGDLRPYQLKGIKWLVSLYNNGLNGILADQMGLGKTVQTIGLFAHLRSMNIHGPFMVIGPLSTLSNWVGEVQRWCPDMPVLLYHGTQAERQALRAKRMAQGSVGSKTFPVVVTSYEIVIADSKHLARYTWKYVVVDEGHRLKNFNCKLLRELRTIPTNNKLLLSGTPLQNNLSELWSLLNFLLPDVFQSLSDFEGWFDFAAGMAEETGDQKIEALEQRNKVVSKLHKLLKPFLLRRIKSDVEDSLPAKQEILLYADMTKEQKKINEQLCDRSFIEAIKQAEEGRKAPLGTLNNMLMQMRNNCNHPDLITSKFDNSPVYPPAEELVKQCGKLQLLDRLLTALKAKGHKILIFSQMTKMLDLLDTYLEQLGHTTARIDGSVKWEDRQAAIKGFNEGSDIFCFLLSTRAGGLGINLTAADTVIIYDSDWNPHQDLQAMDRCHRIGQHKPVLVLRLATAHSVEGRMLKRARSKLALERLVIKKGAFLHQQDEASNKTSMKGEELVEILKGEVDHKEKDVAQSGVISEQMLKQLLDRTHMAKHVKAPYPDIGMGYELVQANDGSGLLSGVE